MSHIYSENYLSSNQFVRVHTDTQINVRLMDSYNYGRYKKGESFTAYNYFSRSSPVEIKPQYPGNWILVLDQRGYQPKQFKYSVQVVTQN